MRTIGPGVRNAIGRPWILGKEVAPCSSPIVSMRGVASPRDSSTCAANRWSCSGLPRGGVPVAFEVARALDAPLDVIVVRKLGVPFQPELGMGAIGEDGIRIINDEIVGMARISESDLAAVEARERAELERRARRFRGDRPRIPLTGRTAVIVDDGIATGSTARAACQVARAQGAARVVLAVPVAPVGWTARIGRDADECIALDTPEPFWAIGQFYADFSQTSDDEVVDCLDARRRACAGDGRRIGPRAGRPSVARRRGRSARGTGPLGRPPHAARRGDRRRGVRPRQREQPPQPPQPLRRRRAQRGGARDAPVRPADRRGGARPGQRLRHRPPRPPARRRHRWLRAQPDVGALPIGYFGASTGAAAALWAAAEPGADIAAVVSRGGRPDLAGPRLGAVTAPTLLIVGGDDDVVLDLNRRAQARLRCENRLAVVPGATHLFEEPGTLEAAAELARDWFTSHLAPRPQPLVDR